MRSKNMQVLTDEVKALHPGVVVYGIGDKAHQLETSDHNEDDTPGSNPEQTDADNIPEHRAIDVMIGPNFTKLDAEHFVASLVFSEKNRPRLRYVIWNGCIWSSRNNFKESTYTGKNKHTDHVHVSGLAADDDNEASWNLVEVPDGPPATTPEATQTSQDLKKGTSGEEVRYLQEFFRKGFPVYRYYVPVKRGLLISVDGDFGPQTEAWVFEFQRRTGLARDGIVGPKTRSLLRTYGYRY